MLRSPRSSRPGDGSTTSGLAAIRHEREWPAFLECGVAGSQETTLDMAGVSRAERDGFPL